MDKTTTAIIDSKESKQKYNKVSKHANTKKQLGQFFTNNAAYILQNMTIPEELHRDSTPLTIIEPFAGKLDLIRFIIRQDPFNITDETSIDSTIDAKTNNKIDISKIYTIGSNKTSNSDKTSNKTSVKFELKLELYDIDPQFINSIVKRDTLLDPPEYSDKYIITNPPYLARNKSKDKTIYDKYNLNDLYKCFIKSLMNYEPLGGIIIVPLNFLCSVRKADIQLRRDFFTKWHILHINIFEEQVFSDTKYAVCSIQFCRKQDDKTSKQDDKTSKQDDKTSKQDDKTNKQDNQETSIVIYPSKISFKFRFAEANSYTIGGEIYQLENKFNITRATKKNADMASNMLLKCIDDNKGSQICIRVVPDGERFIDNTPKLSARSYATIVFDEKLLKYQITIKQQKKLAALFNKKITQLRKKYNSLFLPNYRESNSIARKRISFAMAFALISHLMKDIK